MKYLVLLTLFIFIGCGSSDTITKPILQPHTSTNDQNPTEANSNTDGKIKVPQSIPNDDGTFTAIHTIISDANQNLISDATYICVGDSTRAESRYEGQYLFYTLDDTLRQYNITSHLLARAGHQALEFNNQTAYPTWRDAVSYIPQDGDHTIVDISLGINDYWEQHPERIKRDLKDAILKIKSQKPKTHFLLTVPNRAYNNNEMTLFLRNIYEELSLELHIPLNNLIDGLMPSQEATPYSWYRNDGFNVHLSREGQRVVAAFILKNLLP